MRKKDKSRKEDKNRESGYHGDREKGHIPGQHSPDAGPRHDPPKRRKKDQTGKDEDPDKS